MKHIILALVLTIFPASLFAQSEQATKNCKWPAMRGITPDLDIADFLGESIIGDWLNTDGKGFIATQGMVFPIPESAEVITIYEKNNGLYATNIHRSAIITLVEAGTPNWSFDNNDPVGKSETSVVDPDRIRFEVGCDVPDLPRLIGKGTWEAPKGDLQVTLYFIPITNDIMYVVMEGKGKGAGGKFYIRRGYKMKRMKVVPLTDN